MYHTLIFTLSSNDPAFATPSSWTLKEYILGGASLPVRRCGAELAPKTYFQHLYANVLLDVVGCPAELEDDRTSSP